MIVVAFGSVKRAELAIHIANIRVIDVAVGDISNDFTTAATVRFFFRQIAPRISERAQFFQWHRVKLKRLVGRNAFALEHFVGQRVAIE